MGEADSPRAKPWIALAALTLLYAVAFLDRQLLSLATEPIRADLGISDVQIGLLQGLAFAVFYALFGIPLGGAVDRWNRRLIVMAGVAVWGLATMACGLATSFQSLFAARLLVGAGEAVLGPAAYSILADLFPQRRLTLALSIYSIGAVMGSEASIAAGGALLGALNHGLVIPGLAGMAPWRQMFLIVGLPGIFAGLLMLLVPETRVQGDRPKAGWAQVFAFMLARRRFFICHFVGFAAVMAAAVARMSWAPAYLRRSFALPIEHVAYLLSSFGVITGVIAFLTTGMVVDAMVKRGRRDAHFLLYIFGGLIMVVLGGAAFAMPTVPLFFATFTLVSLPLGMAGVAASAIQLVTPPEIRGRVSAIYLMVISLLGQTGGPLIVASITQYGFGDPAALSKSLSLTFVLLGLIATACFAIGRPAQLRAMADAGHLGNGGGG